MEEIESQIAKIQIGNPKQTNNFVFVLAEKAEGSDAELFLICELPLLELQNSETNKNICEKIILSFRNVYKKPWEDNSFENAISEINEELSKLASMGHIQWINKIHAIIAVKFKNTFYISSCGKVSAFLLRDENFTDISCSAPTTHPLKTFDTFASGKIRLNDLLILSTTQLFNFLSMDKFKDLTLSKNFLKASKTIIKLLKENSDSTVNFGTILNLQIKPGEANEEYQDLENFSDENESKNKYFEKIFEWSKKFLNFKKINKTHFIKAGAQFKNIGSSAKNLVGISKKIVSTTGKNVVAKTKSVSWTEIQNFSTQKKFLFFSVIILFIAVIFNIFFALKQQKSKKQQAIIFLEISESKELLNKANDAILFKDEQKSKELYNLALNKRPKLQSNFSSENTKNLEKLNTLFYETQQKIEKYIKITTLPISVLTSGKALIALPTGFGAQKNNSIVSYDINNQKTLDGIFLQTENILASQPIDNKINISFSENGLFIWQTNLNKNSEIFNQNLPDKLNFGGLAFYPDTSRVYVIDKNESKVVSLKKTNEKFNDFKISVSDKKLKSAESIAIDGNIYILTNDNILKFTKGIEQKFNLPTLLLPFSGKGKIYTEKNYKNIYVLDIGNNRIIVLNKKAELVGIMSDKSFTNLKDFFVDEKNKTIYLLNDSSLLKVNW